MKKLLLSFIASVLMMASVFAQVTTNEGSGLAPTYTSLAAAITALNSATITNSVIITLSGNETAPAGGYSITQLGGTVSNTIIIQGNSSTVTAYTPQVAGQKYDAIFKIIGGDYITIQNFTMLENSANTVATVASNTMTEFGVALFAASTTNGAQNNIIQNNIITLSSATAYQNAIGVFSTCASSSTNGVQAAASIAGTNSNNKIYGNTISGVAQGVYFIAPAQTATVFESGNDIGGSSGGTSNTITFGISNTVGDLGFTSYSGTNPAGIYFRNVVGNSARYNTINSVSTLNLACGGIFSANGTSPTGITYSTIFSNNIITITNVGAVALTGIDFGSGLSTGTIAASNNTITINQNSTAANSAAIIGIKANYASATNTLNTNTITINQNPTVAGAVTSAVTGITAAGIGTTVNVNSNILTFKEALPGGTASFGSGAITYISVAAASGTVNVNSNQFLTTGSTIRSTGNFIGITHEASISVGTTINLNTFTIDRVAASGTVYGTYETTTPSPVSNTITNNTLTFTNLAGTTTAYPIYSLGGASATGTVKAINGNTINVSGTNTGTDIGIQTGYSYGTMNNNSVTLTCASPTVVAYQATGTSAGAYTMTGNSLSLTSSTTSPTSMLGFNLGATGPFQVYNNTFTAMNFTGIITGSPTVSGITCAIGTGNNFYNNVITNISVGAATSTASPAIRGIAITAGTSCNVYKNKIYGITTAGTGTTTLMSGILLAAGTTNNVYNNFIGDLTAPASASPEAIRGINITSTTASGNNNIYYNTIYLNASSTGANFGTTGIYHTTSGTATTAALDLRNNIIVNKSTAAGTGITVAYRRSSATLTNYAATSNNNDFYAANILNDGATSYNISAYKTLVAPRDAVSFSEDPTFISTTGSSVDYLKINTSTATQIESGGANIATYTDDYFGTIRQGNAGYSGTGTAPDVGANEFNGVPLDLTPPTISYFALMNTGSTSNRVLTATITDNSGVPTTDPGLPQIYWKNGVGGTYTNVQGVSIGSNKYTFTFGGGVSLGDVIYYYVVAQDMATIPNLAANPSAGASGFTPNPPACSTPPTTPNSYTIVGCLSGTKTVGSGGDYATLTAAIADLNSNGLCGALTLSLTDASYSGSETFPLTINANGDASATNTVTIKPAVGNTVSITGAVASGPLIKILNNYTIIDGSNAADGITRDLTITNTSVTAPSVILIGSTGTTPVTNSTLKNSIIINGLNTSSAVYVCDGATVGNAGYFNNITIQNNSIQKAYVGVFAIGTVATGNGSGLLITGNDLNASGANALLLMGIYAQGVDGVTISNNNIGNMSTSGAYSPKAIWLATGTNTATVSGNTISGMTLSNTGAYALTGIYVNPGITATSISITNNTISTLSNAGSSLSFAGILSFSPNTSVTNNIVSGLTQVNGYAFWGIAQSGAVNSSLSGNTVSGLTGQSYGTVTGMNIQGLSTGVTVSKNKIYNIKSTYSSGYTVSGFLLSSTSTTANISLSNNVIYDVAGYGSATYTGSNGYGIFISSGGGYNLYYNSVRLSTNQTLSTGLPACLIISSGIVSLDIRNNIFFIDATVGTDRFAIISNSANTAFSLIDFNDYYTTASNLGYIAAANQANLAAWKIATGKDVSSISADPQLASTTDLRPGPLSPLLLAATPIAGITTDYLNITRNVTTPTIGAYEVGADVSGPVIAYTALGNTASTADRTLDATITDVSGVPTSDPGLPRLYWKVNAGAYTAATAVSQGAGVYRFTFGAGVVASDVVSYYVVAQDNDVPTNLASCFPSAGASGFSINPPAVSTPPTSPSAYTIVSSFSGTFNVGPTEPTYTSLTGIAGTPGGFFAAVNSGVVTGNVTVNITGDITETGAIALNQWSEDGAGNYTMTIQPSEAVNKTLSGSYAGGLIRLNGADRVTFNGNFGGSGQYLTFSNTNTGTSNNTIALSNTANNNNIKNCKVYSKYLAVTTTLADNTLIEGNEIYGDVAGNTNYNQAGIYLSTSSTNTKVRKNLIHDFYYTGTSGWACFGIYYNSDATTVTEISNNVIYNINGGGDPAQVYYNAAGIYLKTGGNVQIYANSILMSGDVLGAGTYNGYSSCILIDAPITLLNIRNNSLKNSMGRISGGTTSPTLYVIYSNVANTAYTDINYNNYYFTDQPNVTEYLGFLTSSQADLAAWQTATGKDANSYSTNPNFTSNTNLKPTAGSYLIGTNIAAITTDIEGTTRSNPPDVGAYEGAEAGRWLGGTSTNWATTSNWDNGALPTGVQNVVINSWAANKPQVTLDPGSEAVCNNLTINTGASLTVNAGKALTVNGTLTNNVAGYTGLVVKSGGSLIQSSASVSATAERAVSGWSDDAHGWHFLSAPVAAQAIDPAFTDGTPANYDFYCWWEATNKWVNLKNTTTPPTWSTANVLGVTSGGGNFIPGKGYLVAYAIAAEGTKQFTGALNVADVPVTNLAISAGANNSWHLLGNPFPSALTWATGWSLNNIVSTAKIWNETGAAYTDIASGGIIPALNGFMVQVSPGFGGSNSLTIPLAARVHNTQAWYKNSEDPFIMLVANDPVGQTAQESVIRFIPEATTGFDPDFDSHFLSGFAPLFYSRAGEDNLSTNTLPAVGGTVQIPFDFIKNNGTSFSIEAKTISGIFGPVILNDLKTGASQDLSVNPVYAFTSASGDNVGRFLLSFSHVGIGENGKDNAFLVYASDDQLFVVDKTGKNQGNVFVYNLMGQMIASAKLNGSDRCKLSLNVPTGYYLVKIISPETTQTTKIFIQ